MRPYLPKHIKTKVQILGIYQILGGLYGIYLTLNLMFSLSSLTNLILLIIFIAICLYSYSLLCGILILLKKDNDLKYSLINQYLQLINFTIVGYAFQYVSGVYLFVGINFTDVITFKFTMGISTWYLSFNTVSDEMEVNLNLAALFLIILIDKIKNQIVDHSSKIEISELANNPH